MRDKLIHGYASVNLETVWDVAKNDLPVLQKRLEVILGSVDSGN